MSASSAEGLSPGMSLAAVSAGPRQAEVTARWAIWLTSQRGVSWAGWTTWPLVITQPVGSTNQPVPVSRKAVGVTDWEPPPQLRLTSAAPPVMRTVALGPRWFLDGQRLLGVGGEAPTTRRGAQGQRRAIRLS